MSINLTDEIEVKTKKGKLANAKQIYLEGDNKNLQDAHKDNEDHLNTLDTRSTQIEESLKTIAATGGASNANAVIYDNNVSGLTAINVKGALDELTTRLKDEFSYKGIATPTTNPGTPDGNVFYIAGEGTYTNFSNLVIEAGQLGILKWDGSWHKEVLEIGAGGGNMILEWNTDIATTRKQVVTKKRKAGIQISYKDPLNGWINEQYIGTSFTDLEWVKDKNWEKIVSESEIARLELDIAKPVKVYSSLQEAFSYIPQRLRNFGYKGSFLIKNNPKEFKVVLLTNLITNKSITVKTTLGSSVITTNYQSPKDTVEYTTVARAIYKDIKGKLPDDWALKDYINKGYFVFEYLGEEPNISFNCEETSGSDFEIIFKLEYTDPSSPRLKSMWNFNVGPNGIVNISLMYNIGMGIEDIERDLLNFTQTKSQYATLLPIIEKLDDEPHKYKVVIPYQSSVMNHGSSIPTPPNESTGIRTTIVSSKQMSYRYIIQSVEHKDVEEEYLTKQFVSTDPNNFEKGGYWADYNDETDKLNSVNLWNRIDNTINLDISDGKPIYFSLPMNMNYTAPYTLSIRNLDGKIGMDVTKGYHGGVFIQQAESEMLYWSNRAILVRSDGWCVFKGYSWGMSTMKININKTIKPWLANKLFILREEDFKHYIGVADDYKINIGTRNLATFAGGYNTILDAIFESSPFQNVVLLSTIYNQGNLHSFIKSLSNFDNVNRTIKAISEYWNVPYIDITKQALFTHKANENLIAKMADRLHPAASNPDVRLYVSISEGGAKSGTIKINQSDWNNESSITIADGDNIQSIVDKVLSGLSIKANVKKNKNDTYNYVYMSFNYNSMSTSQKTTLPTVETNETNVTIKIAQKDNQAKQFATFLSSQLTSLFGDLKDKHILWIGTSIPAGNTYGFATGQKYPELIQEITGCRMTNKSKAGSYFRKYDFYNYKNQEGLTPPTSSWNTTKAEGNNTGFSIDDIRDIVNSADSPYLVVIDMGINDYMSDQGVEFVSYDFEHPFNE